MKAVIDVIQELVQDLRDDEMSYRQWAKENKSETEKLIDTARADLCREIRQNILDAYTMAAQTEADKLKDLAWQMNRKEEQSR